MDIISTKDWEKINNIILNLYTAKYENILEDVMDDINELVPHSHSLTYYQPPNYEPGSPVILKSRNVPREYLLSYAEKYSNLDFINWYIDSLKEGVFRHSDVLPDKIREESTFMKEWLAPLDIFHGICIILTEKEKCFGAMFLYRSKSEHDFSDKELEMLKIINMHVSLRFTLYPSNSNVYNIDGIVREPSSHVIFTPRELEILSMIKSGIRKGNLCENLFITKNTLNKHLDNIYKKLDLHTYEDLLQYLQRNL